MVLDPDIKRAPEPPPAEKTPASGNEQADLQAASQGTKDYSHLMPQLKEKKKWPRKLGWILLALIVLAALAAGGYWVVKNKPFSKSKPNAAHHATMTKEKPTPGTAQYTSSSLNLVFNYPKTWKIKDMGAKLTATSPVTKLTDAGGQTQTGQIVLDVEAQSSEDLSAFAHGSAVAVLASEAFTFAHPTSTQQANAYLSFLQYTTTTTKGGLDGIYVTGNSGYKYDQYIPQSDIAQNDPLIRVIFTKCSNAQCTGATTPLTISSTMWKDSSFATPITTMLESLQLQ